MTIEVSVPGRDDLWLQFLLLDVNGTLTDRGDLIPGVQPRIQRLQSALDIQLLSADTFGNLDDIAEQLGGLTINRISRGDDKAAIATRLGASACAAIGNGQNDTAMLRTAGLGIAVLGPEGTSPNALDAADIVTPTIEAGLDLLVDTAVLRATLRA